MATIQSNSIKQPNSQHCFVCGLNNPVGLKLKFYVTAPGVIESTYLAPEHFQGYPGVLHGGIVAAILDEVSGRVHMVNPSNPRFMFTAKLEVKYRKNVPINQPLKIIGKAVKNKGRFAEGWAGIYDSGGNLLAEANSLLIDLPEQPDPSILEDLGWKVYPD